MEFRKVTFFLLFQLLCLYSFSQFSIGKNISIAEQELKGSLKSKGFTFYQKSMIGNHVQLAFSQEFTVIMSVNGFGNVYRLDYATTKIKVYDKLLVAMNFGKWNFTKKTPVKWSKYDEEFHYTYKDFEITTVDLGAYNIHISLME